MNDFKTFADKFGFGLAALIVVVLAVGTFFVKYLWPWLTKQIEEAQTRLHESQKSYIEAMKARDEIEREVFNKMIERMDRMENRIIDRLK